MKGIVFFFGLIWAMAAWGQNSDLIIKASDTVDFTLFIDGREYKTDDATVIKVTEIPEDALLNVNVMIKSSTPMAYFDRHEFNGSNEWVYQLIVPEKGQKLELELQSTTKKDPDYTSFDLGINYIVYKFNKYAAPLERQKGTINAASSLKMKREKEHSDTTRMEGDKKISEKTERKRTVKEKGTSTVIHQERTTISTGDRRETTILKPRKEECEGAWEKNVMMDQMELLAEESTEAGKLYISKKIAIANCFTCSDAGGILEVFETESSRIEIAKFIYPSITDPENLDELEGYFDSPSSWEAVKLYIEIKYE